MLKIVVEPSGQLAFIYSDGLRSLFDEGKASIRRASHVEPCGTGWEADLKPVGGPVLGPFDTRDEALMAELQWLNDNPTSWLPVIHNETTK